MIRVFEAFAGVGAQRMALERAGIPHEVVGISEIDKFALQSYEAIHGETTNFGDIKQLTTDALPDFDLFTYSFPCTSISAAGQQKGMEKGSDNASALLWECEKIIREKRPRYLLMENVKQLVGKKFYKDFEVWIQMLEDYGYKSYWKVLNAKDYGVPQNRERVFMVSSLDEGFTYDFPEKTPLTTRLADVLENDVAPKFYLKPEIQAKFKPADKLQIVDDTYGFSKEPRLYDTVSPTLRSGRHGLKVQYPKGAAMRGRYTEKGIEQQIEVRKDDLSNALTTVQKDSLIAERSIEVIGIVEEDKWFESMRRVYGKEGISPTLTTMSGGHRQPKILEGTHEDAVTVNSQIRKLTPLECWRLMGFRDEDFQKAKDAGVSDSQLYRQAGNSIVVDVLRELFKEWFKDEVPGRTTNL